MRKSLNLLLLCAIFSTLNGCASGMVSGRSGTLVVMPEEKDNGYAFLVDKQPEEKGYGLYSYLLFKSPPTKRNKDLYLEVIKNVIEQLFSVEELENQGFRREELNITYLLIKGPLPSGEGSLSPEWILKNYNYPRAQFFLSRLPRRTRQDGPYIVSTLRPISRFQGGAGPKDHLAQNLSLIPPARTDLIHDWVKAFLRRAARPKKWNRKSGKDLARELRLALAIAAEGLPQVQEAIKTWVVWGKEVGLIQRHKPLLDIAT